MIKDDGYVGFRVPNLDFVKDLIKTQESQLQAQVQTCLGSQKLKILMFLKIV